jgi:hypothetical protein
MPTPCLPRWWLLPLRWVHYVVSGDAQQPAGAGTGACVKRRVCVRLRVHASNARTHAHTPPCRCCARATTRCGGCSGPATRTSYRCGAHVTGTRSQPCSKPLSVVSCACEGTTHEGRKEGRKAPARPPEQACCKKRHSGARYLARVLQHYTNCQCACACAWVLIRIRH